MLPHRHVPVDEPDVEQYAFGQMAEHCREYEQPESSGLISTLSKQDYTKMCAPRTLTSPAEPVDVDVCGETGASFVARTVRPLTAAVD